MNTQWIKRSEREPMQADFPILGGAYVLGGSKAWDEDYGQDPKNIPSYFTHWRSIKADPPPREPTQRERDLEADKAAYQKYLNDSNATDGHDIALNAIYAERPLRRTGGRNETD